MRTLFVLFVLVVAGVHADSVRGTVLAIAATFLAGLWVAVRSDRPAGYAGMLPRLVR